MNRFNIDAIKQFGIENDEMAADAPNATFAPEICPLINYLDLKFVCKHVLARLPEDRRDHPSILDIGAGKGRMTRRFLDFAERVVALEPYYPFFEAMKASCSNDRCEIHCKDLDTYSIESRDRFDMIYISGVTPYLSDEELKKFMRQVRAHLQTGGAVCIRALGHESRRAVCDYVIHRTPQENIDVAESVSLKCVYRRRSYPLIIFNKLQEILPNKFSSALLRGTTKPWTYPIWELLAEMNIPRGDRLCFTSYVCTKG